MNMSGHAESDAMNASEEDGERDWASLPPELLNLIAKRPPCEISDFVRFRAVCHAWRSSTPAVELPPQFPWILDKRKDPRDRNWEFYSPALDKTYTIPVPRSLDKNIFSGPPSNGHMFTINAVPFRTRPWPPRFVSLLNPLANHEIPLPTCPYVPGNFWIGLLQNQTGEYEIVCYVHSDSQHCVLAFCQYPSHQNNWHKVELDPDIRFWRHFYFKGMLFSIDRSTGVTKVTSTADGALAYVVPSPVKSYSQETEVDSLVQDFLGNILRIYTKYRSFTYDVYRLDVRNKDNSSPCWVKVSSIGNQAIFMDMEGCFVLRADESSGIKENTIYLLGSRWTGISFPLNYWAAWVDIQTGRSQRLPCPFKEPVSWLLPNLHRL